MAKITLFQHPDRILYGGISLNGDYRCSHHLLGPQQRGIRFCIRRRLIMLAGCAGMLFHYRLLLAGRLSCVNETGCRSRLRFYHLAPVEQFFQMNGVIDAGRAIVLKVLSLLPQKQASALPTCDRLMPNIRRGKTVRSMG